MERRQLQFHDLGEVVRDAEALLKGGYDKAGAWDLSQVCEHLADWMTFPVSGFPKASGPVRLALWALRHTVGRWQRRKITRTNRMPAGAPTIPTTVHLIAGDAGAAVSRLRRTAERFRAHPGPWHPSPLFGALTKEEWTQVQLVHCAHHLSFLRPRT
jgi:hypothetical protein